MTLEQEWDEFSAWRDIGQVDEAMLAVVVADMARQKKYVDKYETALWAFNRHLINKATFLAALDRAC